jgi:hypothetical protein
VCDRRRARVIAILAAALAVSACDTGPTCAERGGRQVLDHMSPVITNHVVIMVPVYRCELGGE